MLVTLEVVTPRGLELTEEGLDEVVMRRREREFVPGSEVAVFPRHGPMLVRVPASPVRFTKGGRVVTFRVGAGFVEVLDDHVTFLVDSLTPPSPQSRAGVR